MTYAAICPHCSAKIELATNEPDEEVQCPQCQATCRIRVPGSSPVSGNEFSESFADREPQPGILATVMTGAQEDDNPYQAPSMLGHTAADREAVKPIDEERPGLPWENSGNPFWRFTKTSWLLLRHPVRAFEMMQVRHALARSWLYCLLGSLICSVLVSLVIGVSGLVMLRPSIAVTDFLVPMLILMVILVVLAGTAPFVWAGVVHGCLRLLQGAKFEYRATAKAMCYLQGLLMLLVPVLVLGFNLISLANRVLANEIWSIAGFAMLLAFLGYSVTPLIGAHSASVGKALGTVALASAAMFGLLVSVVVVFFTVCLLVVSM